MTAYRLAFQEDARSRGSFKTIWLPAPTGAVESVALEIFLHEIQTLMPKTAIRIKGDS
jgi:hypothetical protein